MIKSAEIYPVVLVSLLVLRLPTGDMCSVTFLPPLLPGANRRVSCKDLGGGDCQGWMYKRKEGHGLRHRHWVKRWFVLKQKYLYYFKDPEVSYMGKRRSYV